MRRFFLFLLCFFGATVLRAGPLRLVNLSSRAEVSTGDGVLISGFVIGPGQGSTILIRAVGPTLAGQGVRSPLGDPTLALHDASGRILATNDNWSAADAAAMATVGAFALPPGSRDAALIRTLPPGVYSVVVNGAASPTGVSLLELYELDSASGPARLTNLSTRARIGSGENLLISGFVVSGASGTRRLLVRAAGPALAASGVSGYLVDPQLRVVNAVTGATLGTNDNWETPAESGAANAATLTALFTTWGASPFAPGSKDAALVADFPPGVYSFDVTGVGTSSGVALVEIYDVTPEGLPTVTLAATQATADESGGHPGEFTLTRSGDLTLPLEVTYTFGGTATVGSDYVAGTGNATFLANAATVKIPVVIQPDLLTEGTETAVLTLNPGSGYTVGAPASATVSISDQPATLYVSTLRPPASATGSTASGTATILLSADGTYASVSLAFSNLSSTETVAYLRLGSPGEVGTELLRLANGQVDSTHWNIAARGAYSAADILQALRDGRIFISLETSSFPGGELRGAFILGSGSQNFVAPASVPAPDLSTVTDTDAARFLTQATFGPTPATITALKQKGYAAWLTEQLAAPATLHRDATMADFAATNAGGQTAVNGVNTLPGQVHRQAAWWKISLTADDQLRQRVALALSEIFVVSDVNGTVNNHQEALANYYDLLARDAFGNFRTLLEDVTLSPVMGVYLSSFRNAKATSATGPQPDENYAREVMQLFTIGLNQLQPDGTLKLDARALPIPTYDQTIITAMARVFTGWAYHNTNPTTANFRNSTADWLNPMTSYASYHDVAAKTLFNGLVLPANQTGPKDLADTLDALFQHANTAPFISRQLIQRLVTSNPSPGYVYRVAQVFANNGAGVRGDLAAVVRAILTDYEARTPAVAAYAGYGKLKEPLLRVTALLRAAAVASPTSRYAIANANSQTAQSALSAPTVFNFFEPDYVSPGPLTAAGLYAPEFQILTATTAISAPNYLYNFIFTTTTYQGVNLAFTDQLPLASQSAALVDQLNLLFCANTLSTATRTRLVSALNSLPAATSATDRVRTALYLVVTSADAAVQQ